MEKLNHRDRLNTIIAGEKPDRFAASFWRHFFHMEHHAEGTIEAMVGFQREFDWDFMKINPRADFHTQDWGLKLKYSHREFRKHQKVRFPIEKPADWAKIQPLSLNKPALAEHLKVVAGIRKAVGKELPLLMTVFSPLAVAGRLVSERETFVEHLRNHPDLVIPALEAITDTFSRFATELRNAGADGLFFATTYWASSESLTWPEYERYGIPYDLDVIKAADNSAINLLHVCHSHNYLRELDEQDYCSLLYNWDSEDPTNVPLDKGCELFPDKAMVGGIDHEGWLLNSTADEIVNQIKTIKGKYDPARVILGPGCAIPPEVPLRNLRAIRENL